MVSLTTPEHFQMDKRNLERQEVAGNLDRKDLESHLKNLPDSSDNFETVPIWENPNTLPSRRIRREDFSVRKPVETRNPEGLPLANANQQAPDEQTTAAE